MRFESPNTLWLLLVVPAVLWIYIIGWRKKRELMEKFIHPNLLSILTESVWFTMRKWKIALTIIAIVFLIIASARPQWGFKWEEVKQRGLDIIVVIDTSRSMLAEDIKPNRLERAKLSAIDLMTISKSDRFGLVAFAGVAFLQCPLTLDEEAFRQSVNALDTEIMPQAGTAIAEAIRTAAEGFKEGTDNYKIIVLFSDGEDHEEGAIEAAEEAAKKGIKIFTVGVGTPEGETLRVRSKNGRLETVTDETGKPVITRLNPALLQQIAAKCGGFYLQLTGAKTMETLYEMGLAPLPKGEQSARLIKKYNERFYIPLTIAILLLIIETLLPERKTPVKPLRFFGKLGVFIIVVMLLNANNLEASVRSAINNYNEGKYKTALQDYKELLKKKPDDPRLAYNAGNAAYMIGRYEEAANYFNQAMNAPKNPQLQQKACYNYGNALYKLGEQEEDINKKIDYWKQAIVQYETALRFNPQDADAKFNLEFVKKKLEELMKQQQQQMSQNQGSEKNQDEQNQQDKKNQQGQQNQQNQKNQEQKGDKQKQEQQKGQNKQEQQAQSQKQNEKTGGQQQQAQQSSGGKTNSAANIEGKVVYMTPQQAMRLLEAQKSEEKILLFTPEVPQKRDQGERSVRNW